jgi:hypothetical protein
VGCSEWREEGLGEEWRPEERCGRSRGLYTSTVDTVHRGIGCHGLGSGAVCSGWRSELSARVWSVWSGVKRCRQGQVIFRARVRLVELTPVALSASANMQWGKVEGVRCHAGTNIAQLVFVLPRLGTRGLAPGALDSQATGPERGDRAALAAVWSGAITGSWSGGYSEAIGEAGRPGVRQKLLAH